MPGTRTMQLICILVIFWIQNSTFASDSNKVYAQQIVQLRNRIDELESEIDKIQASAKAERNSLQTQKGDLEVLLRKEKIRQETLKRLRAKQLAEKRKAESWSARLMQPAKDAASKVSALIENSLPLKKKERLEAVREIAAKLKGPRPDPSITISRLWQLVEDELKLTSESGIHRQVIRLHGKDILAEVAHLGMAVLYFRTEDDRYGWARPDGEGHYIFEPFSNEEYSKAVKNLFEALKKQIRKGFFTLPIPCLNNSGVGS